MTYGGSKQYSLYDLLHGRLIAMKWHVFPGTVKQFFISIVNIKFHTLPNLMYDMNKSWTPKS